MSAASILIVDDEFGLAEMLREMLRDCGYEAVVAINGRLALQILGERHIDLVLTDMMMPVMDGAELAAAVRRMEEHRHTPIIMMTSLTTDVLTGHELFDVTLRKPFSPDLLLDAIHTALRLPKTC